MFPSVAISIMYLQPVVGKYVVTVQSSDCPQSSPGPRRQSGQRRAGLSCGRTVEQARHAELRHHTPVSMNTIGLLLILASVLGLSDQLYLSEDGGYRDIVVKISDNLDMKKCNDIISGIKVGKFLIKIYFFIFYH